ncbi:Ig-like domain-containing protein [Pseudonocardia sp. GCM10023141]
MALASMLLAATALLAGCVSTASATPGPAPQAPPAAAPAAAPQVTLTPADGATGVVPAAPITVAATDGTLTGVTLTAANGTTIPGALSADGHTWTATAPPAYKTVYHLAGTATGAGGSTPVTGAFTTVSPMRLAHAETNIGDGDVVGIAAPIEIRFDRTIPASGRAAAERALKVTTSTPVTGSWAWLPDADYGSRVHWRPATYWPASTTVTVNAHLYGVDMGNAVFGANDVNTTFTVGRAQIVQADVTTHRMVVIRDGQIVSDLPASYGLESDPNRVTKSGTHIVMSKAETVLMTNIPYGYKDLPEHWAVRISNNGEFIHANPASVWAQGKSNTTHGCVNLSTANAKAYYDTAIYGDPVEVTGSSRQLSAADGDVYDWAIPLDTWKSMSALAQ